jgi:hypothetical protein
MVVDAADGTVLGNVDLGDTPEQTVADGKGMSTMSSRSGRAASRWSTSKR